MDILLPKLELLTFCNFEKNFIFWISKGGNDVQNLFLLWAGTSDGFRDSEHAPPKTINFFFMTLILTWANSFSISTARITKGPRTAYSIVFTFGFRLSKFNTLLDAILEEEIDRKRVDNRETGWQEMENNATRPKLVFILKIMGTQRGIKD